VHLASSLPPIHILCQGEWAPPWRLEEEDTNQAAEVRSSQEHSQTPQLLQRFCGRLDPAEAVTIPSWIMAYYVCIYILVNE
jgi:hypothetical protein